MLVGWLRWLVGWFVRWLLWNFVGSLAINLLIDRSIVRSFVVVVERRSLVEVEVEVELGGRCFGGVKEPSREWGGARVAEKGERRWMVRSEE